MIMPHTVATRLMPVISLLLFIAAVMTATVADAGNAQGKAQPASAWDNMPTHPTHTDHAFFFFEPFADGPAVTRACLECHPDSAREVMQTSHWNWQGDEVMVPGHEGAVRIGKRNVINNFCIGVQSNWPACTMCHIGYGWEDEQFDFKDAARVDCLVCHDNSGTYQKKFRGAGVPDESVDLLEVARSVGMPRRQNCGGCHFQGGGGNAVKHGDMDETLLFPSERIDVHMGKHDMQCVDCHRTEHHLIRGRAMAVSVDDKNHAGMHRLPCTEAACRRAPECAHRPARLPDLPHPAHGGRYRHQDDLGLVGGRPGPGYHRRAPLPEDQGPLHLGQEGDNRNTTGTTRPRRAISPAM